MVIETIVRDSEKKDAFSVKFESGEVTKVSVAQIADFGLYPGLELSDGEYEELRSALELSSSKAKALRILGSRRLSSGEIERRLRGRGINEETASETARWLESIGAVDDPDYAATIVRHYMSKGYGVARIRDELYRRGIPRELWDEALENADGFEDAAHEYLLKKLRGSSDRDDLRRAKETLCRRGYSYSEASEAVRRYLETVM